MDSKNLAFASEPYTINENGNYVGCDGFIVPKDFSEYYDRSYLHPDGSTLPMGIRRFIMKKLHKKEVDEATLEMEQDLLLHLYHLPVNSKHRRAGKTDRIQVFDPARQHGASSKRFHNYVARLLNNYFCTLLNKQKKNPVYNPNNLSIVTFEHAKESAVTPLTKGEITEELVYKNLSVGFHASMIAKDTERAHFNTLFIEQFKDYVRQASPEMLPVIDAIADSSSLKDARQVLGITGRAFEKQREQLDLLKDCFLRGESFSASQNAAKNRRNDRLKVMRAARRKKVTRFPIAA